MTPAETKEIAEFDSDKAEVQLAVAPMMAMKVIDVPSRDQARAALAQLRTLEKRVEQRRVSITKPLQDRVKAMIDLAKRVLEPVDLATRHLNDQITRFEIQERERRAAEAKRLEAEEQERRRQAQLEREKLEREAREKAEAERKALADAQAAEAKAAAEQQRLKQEAASLFGRRTNEALIEAERKAMAEQQAAELRAAEERRERDRLAEQARLDREEADRRREADQAKRALEAERLKGARRECEIIVTNLDLVPVQFLNRTVKLAELKKEWREGRNVPGIEFKETLGLTVRAEPVPSLARVEA